VREHPGREADPPLPGVRRPQPGRRPVIALFLVACFVGIVFWIVRQWENPPTKGDEPSDFWRAW
jgi:hypothetical protein